MKMKLLILIVVVVAYAESVEHFDSIESWCNFHCDQTAIFHSELHPNCVLNCPAPKRDLTEQTVHSVDFVDCVEKNNSFQMKFLLDNNSGALKPFQHFLEQFRRVYHLILHNLTNKPNPSHCQLSLLPKTHEQVGKIVNKTPTLVKLQKQQQHRSKCVAEINTLCDTTTTPFLNRDDENGVVLLVHVNEQKAHEIDALDCVDFVTRLPALFKLVPLARSSSSFYKRDVKQTPALLINLSDDCDGAAVLKQLNDQVQQQIGHKSLLSLHNEQQKKEMVLTLPSMKSFQAFATCLSLLLNNANIEWVDIQPVFTGGAYSTSLVGGDDDGHNSPNRLGGKRRLVEYVNDVAGVEEAQKAGITGNGVVVGVTDTGLYLDHDQFMQTSRDIYDKVDQSARKVVSYQTFGDKYDQGESNGECGHGTHVSGIVAGSSNSGKGNVGIAYSSKIAFMDIGTSGSCTGTGKCPVALRTPLTAEPLLSMQSKAGAKIFSFSWGTYDSDYSSQALDIDKYIYENPETLILVAVGNSGEEGRKVSSPSGAKNVISVGASLSSAASFDKYYPSVNCEEMYNPDTVAAFSSFGPTQDGRMKPDLVAPGQSLKSAKSLAPGQTKATSEMCLLQGTSQATPAAAGMAILIYEWLRDGYWKNGKKDTNYGMKTIPGFLIKALMIHSSIGLKRRLASVVLGQQCSTVKRTSIGLSYPDAYQGYGRPVFSNIAMFPTTDKPFVEKVFFLPNSSAPSAPEIDHKGVHSYNFTVKSGETLRVTLVWNDPAGSLSDSKLLQHDLDLVISIPGNSKKYYPLSGKGSNDRLNNVEMVQVTYEELAKNSPASTFAGSSSSSGGASVNGTDSKPIVVVAVITGFSVLNGKQSYSLVASSGVTDRNVVAGDGTNTGFWKSWMTIVAIVVGVLSFMCMIFLCSRRRHTSGRGGGVGQRQPGLANRYPGQQQEEYHRHGSTQQMTNYSVMPNNNTGNTLPSGQATNPYLVQSASTQGADKCPYCAFETPDSVVLVNHVESMHRSYDF